MSTIIERSDAPSHLFAIPELDFSDDLFTERLGGPWFRLGAWTVKSRCNERNVENVVSRQSLLLDPGAFADIFDHLDSVGNAIGHLGRPGGLVVHSTGDVRYSYAPFHKFQFPFTSIVGEPLVFVRSDTSGVQLFINPDLWLFFELEERAPSSGIWWDQRRGVEALRRRVIEDDNLAIVEIRVEHLLKYLQMRQLSLIIGHYRHLHLLNPSRDAVARFVKTDVTLGSPAFGAKAIFQNWGLRKDVSPTAPFLQRRLHLWFEIKPPLIDVEDPWAEEPAFDPHAFTLPTHVGPAAPARWTHFRQAHEHPFAGEDCDFMTPVYFRQEVLMKYEGASGFDVSDDGSVSCRHYWGLVRSTRRLGNELIATAIGDFAEGVPFDEWPHWKHYAVEPPSTETATTLREEQTVPEVVTSLVRALQEMNGSFARMAATLGLAAPEPAWNGSDDSLACRQLKWVYPATAGDDEFLKRAMLASTLVIEGLKSTSLRHLANAIGPDLHMNDESQRRPLGSRRLLERLTLIAVLIEDFQPDVAIIPDLLKVAEGKGTTARDVELQHELTNAHRRVRDELAPLAFLYELRTHGGLAHAPNPAGVAVAAARLGLPKGTWHRGDYIRLLNLIANSVERISAHLSSAAQIVDAGGLPGTLPFSPAGDAV